MGQAAGEASAAWRCIWRPQAATLLPHSAISLGICAGFGKQGGEAAKEKGAGIMADPAGYGREGGKAGGHKGGEAAKEKGAGITADPSGELCGGKQRRMPANAILCSS